MGCGADFTCGSPLSPAACSFSFIRATFAAVAAFFAPLRPLLLDPSFDSEQKDTEKIENSVIKAIKWLHFWIYSPAEVFISHNCFLIFVTFINDYEMAKKRRVHTHTHKS